jgi:hypothetical protein
VGLGDQKGHMETTCERLWWCRTWPSSGSLFWDLIYPYLSVLISTYKYLLSCYNMGTLLVYLFCLSYLQVLVGNWLFFLMLPRIWAFVALQCAPYSQLLSNVKVTPPPALVGWQIADFILGRGIWKMKACLTRTQEQQVGLASNKWETSLLTA